MYQRRKIFMIGIIFSLLVVVFGLTGCSLNNSVEVIKDVEPKLFIFKKIDSSKEDLYIKKSGTEPEKIASNVLRGSYITSLDGNKVIYRDNENNSYLYEKEKERYKLGTDLSPWGTVLSSDETSIYYLTDKDDLYVKKPEKERLKVANNVFFYRVYDNNVIYFVDNEDNLFRTQADTDKEKIASDVDYFRVTGEDALYYVSLDQDLYLYENSDKNKIATGVEWDSVRVSSNGEIITFLNDFNYDKYYGELFFKTKDADKYKIASDVSSHYISADNKYVYYLLGEGKLYQYDIKNNEKNQLANNVYSFDINIDSSWITYITEDEDLYILESGNSEKVASDVNLYRLAPDKKVIYYLTNDNNLYIKDSSNDKEKLLSSILKISFEYDNIYYLTEDEKIGYIKVGNNTTNLLMDNLDNYQAIYAGNNLLFERVKNVNDVIGYWYNAENDGYIQFTNDYVRFYPDLSEEKIAFEITDKYEDGLTFKAEDEYIDIYFNDDGTITMADYYESLHFTKATKADAEKRQQEEVKKQEIKNNISDYVSIVDIYTESYYYGYDVYYTVVNNSGYDLEGLNLEIHLSDSYFDFVTYTTDYIYYIDTGTSYDSGVYITSYDPDVSYVDVYVISVENLY